MRVPMTWLGKSVLVGLGLFHRKGTALPGLTIEKLSPGYLKTMLDQLPQGVIIVTGTNGKTTTTKIIVELLRASGLRVLTNPSGSNFVRGIIAAIAKHATLGGKLPYDIAVFEQDEAHAVLFAKRYQPTGVVALNVMRDQMDRFGEIDTTAKLIGKLVERAKEWVVLNTNDKRIAALAKHAAGRRITWFGHSEKLQKAFIDDDQLYSQTPTFFEAEMPDVCLHMLAKGGFGVNVGDQSYVVMTPLEGTHNAMNATAALATLTAAQPSCDIEAAVRVLTTTNPAFGRGETVTLPGDKKVRLQLVKNPAGFRHALHGAVEGNYDSVGIAINDDYADGRDVSWLWDVDFTPLADHYKALICGGVRAADMAVRLKYDDLSVHQVEPILTNFLAKVAKATESESIIFCTYTAMLALRRQLKRHDKRLRGEGL